MELQFLKFLESIHSPILDKLMVFITSLGNGGIFWIGLGLFFLLQNNRTSKKKALGLFLSLIIFSIVGLLILKPLIGRPRPFMVESFNLLLKLPMGYSFPSGHTSYAFTFATIVTMLNKNKPLVVFTDILAILIALSRLYLYVHFPTDVIAGAVFGIIIGLLAIKIYESPKYRKIKEKYNLHWA